MDEVLFTLRLSSSVIQTIRCSLKTKQKYETLQACSESQENEPSFGWTLNVFRWRV